MTDRAKRWSANFAAPVAVGAAGFIAFDWQGTLLAYFGLCVGVLWGRHTQWTDARP